MWHIPGSVLSGVHFGIHPGCAPETRAWLCTVIIAAAIFKQKVGIAKSIRIQQRVTNFLKYKNNIISHTVGNLEDDGKYL